MAALREELAGWTHSWSTAASLAFTSIESIPIGRSESPASATGQRDAMAMVLVTAAQNVRRGAEALLGRGNAVIHRRHKEGKVLRQIRNYLEHFDAYLEGSGNRQRKYHKKDGAALDLDTPGLHISSSRGGGPDGHTVSIEVTERRKCGGTVHATHEIPTRTIVVAARTLTRDVFKELGLLDERHLGACEACRDPESI